MSDYNDDDLWYNIFIISAMDESQNFIEPLKYRFDKQCLTFDTIFDNLIHDIKSDEKFINLNYCILYDDDIIYKSSGRHYNFKKYYKNIDKSINCFYFKIIIYSDLITDIIDSCQVMTEYYIHRNKGRKNKYNECTTTDPYCYSITNYNHKTTMKIKIDNNNMLLLKHNEYILETRIYKIYVDIYYSTENKQGNIYVEFYTNDDNSLNLVYSYSKYLDINFNDLCVMINYDMKRDSEIDLTDDKISKYLHMFNNIFEDVSITHKS